MTVAELIAKLQAEFKPDAVIVNWTDHEITEVVSDEFGCPDLHATFGCQYCDFGF